ncbi:MAG: DUF2975 domain-containing protein [Anaerolineales bacterium]|nr:DUF2975 domain-containing protein [Anaerolineales bacterium]
MKSSRLPKSLKLITTILLVVMIFSFVTMIGVTILAGAGAFDSGNAEPSISLPIYFVPDGDSYTLASDAWGSGEIVWASGQVEFESAQVDSVGTAVEIIVWLLMLGIPTGFILVVMRRIFGSMESGSPFIPANVNRIRWLAGLLLGTAVLAQIVQARIGELLLTNIRSSGLEIIYRFELDPTILVIGLIILSLAEVFRYGLELQAEADLTV